MRRKQPTQRGKRSIFRSVFVPFILVMVLQATIYYLAAVYGGVEESLSQNAADILTERLLNRKNELETQLNSHSFELDGCVQALQRQYEAYEKALGEKPLTDDPQLQIQYLSESADTLVDTLRHTETNGVFLILNNLPEKAAFSAEGQEKKYGLCIRNMDQESGSTARADLLLERSPSSIVAELGCTLDSWWEAWYTFDSPEQGSYYYNPLNAAWDNPEARSLDLAYFADLHHLSASDQRVVSYSVPLFSSNGYPFGVLGVELTTKYLASLLPSSPSNPCYVLGLREAGDDVLTPIVGTGTLYKRGFSSDSTISCADRARTGGFTLVGRGGVKLYGNDISLSVYNNNNPFEDRQLVLLALEESDVMFAYIGQVKLTLLFVALLCLGLGVLGIFLASRRFAAPITALSQRVRDMEPQAGFHLGRLNIVEIDQLVESIEELTVNASKNVARTEFFSRMSHDMRTPMNAIISFSSPELLEGATEVTKDDYLEKIHDSGVYLLGLINEVLDMTKIESENVELHPVTIQASRLCDTAIPIIEKLAQKKNITFTKDIAADPSVSVLADTQHLSQIVMNLLSNAVKFTPEGGNVWLSVSFEDSKDVAESTICQIVVKDSGIGMSAKFMQRLYTPFERESTASEGTGLGLSISKKLVSLMDGSIDCRSEQNVGTTFTVRIPLVKTAGVAPEESARRAARSEDLKVLRGKRVLVCEDNAINTQIITHLLGKLGVDVVVAQNGQIGVNTFADSDPSTFDAILMDIRMPVMDGLEATRRIRAMARPDAVAIPIIAMTANAFDEDAQASKAAGMNEHLSKPIETQKFFDVLARYLRKND